MVSLELNNRPKFITTVDEHELAVKPNLGLEESIGIRKPDLDHPESPYEQPEFEIQENYQNLSVSSAEFIEEFLDSPMVNEPSPANLYENESESSVEIIVNDPEALDYEEFEFQIDEDSDKEIDMKSIENSIEPVAASLYHDSIAEIPLNVSVDQLKEECKSSSETNKNQAIVKFSENIHESCYMEQGMQTEPVPSEEIDINNIPSFLMQSIREILKEELQQVHKVNQINEISNISSIGEVPVSDCCSGCEVICEPKFRKRTKSISIYEPLRKPIIQCQQEKKASQQPVIQADCSGAKYKRPTGKEIQKKVQQLSELGFNSSIKAISALAKTNYDVMLSVEILLNN